MGDCSLYGITIDEEEVLLKSHVRPVVILDARKHLADGVSRGLSTIGCILPYMPIHYLLFRYLSTPAIVFTSGNLS
ncbi:MAG TPA: Sua5/YciO/YrdC/YwlC family protein, partial [Candidatus Sabulitectum sp.]|nr:Sua5/YciO/YrdC/YwlC family protein [Candidatus Sabulitectum sp.]